MNRLFPLLLLLTILGCGSSEESKKSFTPPANGKITEEMATKYVKASQALMEAIKVHTERMNKFRERYGLDSDLRELTDSTYRAEHPEVIRAWDKLQEKWKQEEDKAYRIAGISEDEFTWIASALTDTINSEIQKEIEKKLEAIQKE
ncbi:MAG TPA: hypothetical protein EYP60_07815 [bacterium (Candidatus Stahlbacteria)]|nr:hypothetical protein [Candidatus Stahlbacteria bacterium]